MRWRAVQRWRPDIEVQAVLAGGADADAVLAQVKVLLRAGWTFDSAVQRPAALLLLRSEGWGSALPALIARVRDHIARKFAYKLVWLLLRRLKGALQYFYG